ncbi:unnamed protein product [Prorocentrum cordatum]|uniref:WWE domain-containing protein n=1 Tax=Prorocentrum cordatum TaxID=2364126 RepID=A0ABN9XQ07_9DINO|nr:unnamed protein product [Polarella glacialis]
MVWQVQLRGQWQDMSEEDSVQMDAYQSSGRPQFQVQMQGQLYHVDLHGSPPWTQTNSKTGTSRRIRRFSPPSRRPAAAPLLAPAAPAARAPPTPSGSSGFRGGHLDLEGQASEGHGPGGGWLRGLFGQQGATTSRAGYRQALQEPPARGLAGGPCGLDWGQAGILVALVVLIVLLWDTVVVYPLKLLVVFLHETSHGIAAVLTGGSVDHIEVSSQEGGVCYTIGGNRFLTLSAGYLGSTLWGGLILVLASRTLYSRFTSMGLGVMTGLIGLVFVRPFLSFGQLFALAAGAALFASGHYLSDRFNDLLLRVIGLTSCMYAVLDIKSDVLERPEARSDAAMLAEVTGIPTVLWGLLWISVAAVAVGYFVTQASKPQAAGSL